MRYINATVQSFAEYVLEKDRKIILFGAGAVCRTFIPYIAKKYDFTDNIIYIIDNNPAKQGNFIDINDKSVPIVNADVLKGDLNEYCVLITNGDFYPVIMQLDQIEKCRDVCCFIAAYIQLDRVYDKTDNYVFKDTLEAQIPKIIHYCWFSGNPIPDNLQKCIDTWKDKCPDYEIIRWDETNIDLGKYRYTKEAYQLQKWGYIPDIIRLEKLYEFGGFYFDTDVKIIKNLDVLRYQEAFCGRERAGHVNFGGGSGCKKGCELIKDILDFRKNEPFDLGNGRFNAEASGYYETTPLMKMGLRIEDINQKLPGINVYASEFFSPYNYVNGDNIQNDNTFSVHYFSGSWLEDGEKFRSKTRKKYMGFKNRLEEV